MAKKNRKNKQNGIKETTNGIGTEAGPPQNEQDMNRGRVIPDQVTPVHRNPVSLVQGVPGNVANEKAMPNQVAPAHPNPLTVPRKVPEIVVNGLPPDEINRKKPMYIIPPPIRQNGIALFIFLPIELTLRGPDNCYLTPEEKNKIDGYELNKVPQEILMEIQEEVYKRKQLELDLLLGKESKEETVGRLKAEQGWNMELAKIYFEDQYYKFRPTGDNFNAIMEEAIVPEPVIFEWKEDGKHCYALETDCGLDFLYSICFEKPLVPMAAHFLHIPTSDLILYSKMSRILQYVKENPIPQGDIAAEDEFMRLCFEHLNSTIVSLLSIEKNELIKRTGLSFKRFLVVVSRMSNSLSNATIVSGKAKEVENVEHRKLDMNASTSRTSVASKNLAPSVYSNPAFGDRPLKSILKKTVRTENNVPKAAEKQDVIPQKGQTEVVVKAENATKTLEEAKKAEDVLKQNEGCKNVPRELDMKSSSKVNSGKKSENLTPFVQAHLSPGSCSSTSPPKNQATPKKLPANPNSGKNASKPGKNQKEDPFKAVDVRNCDNCEGVMRKAENLMRQNKECKTMMREYDIQVSKHVENEEELRKLRAKVAQFEKENKKLKEKIAQDEKEKTGTKKTKDNLFARCEMLENKIIDLEGLNSGLGDIIAENEKEIKRGMERLEEAETRYQNFDNILYEENDKLEEKLRVSDYENRQLGDKLDSALKRIAHFEKQVADFEKQIANFEKQTKTPTSSTNCDGTPASSSTPKKPEMSSKETETSMPSVYFETMNAEYETQLTKLEAIRDSFFWVEDEACDKARGQQAAHDSVNKSPAAWEFSKRELEDLENRIKQYNDPSLNVKIFKETRDFTKLIELALPQWSEQFCEAYSESIDDPDIPIKSSLPDACCASCQFYMYEGEIAMSCPNSHKFHKRCVWDWITENKNCQTCRAIWLNPEEFPVLRRE